MVVAYRSADRVVACLDALGASDEPTEVLVVVNRPDDGVVDPTAELVRRGHPGAEVLETGANLGYTGGNDLGFRWSSEHGHDYVLVLNPDVEVDPEMVGRLADALDDHPEAAAACPKVLLADPADTIWYAGAVVDWATGESRHVGWREADDGRFDDESETERAVGSCVLFRARALAEVGGFDNRYFLYYEETDWSLRARDAGWTIRYVPSARAVHAVSSSSGGEGRPLYWYYMTRNALLFMRDHAGEDFGPFRRRFRWACARRAVGFARRPTSEHLRSAYAVVAGWRDFRLGRLGGRQGMWSA